MGTAPSTNNTVITKETLEEHSSKSTLLLKTQHEVVRLMMPLYYNTKQLSPQERELAVKSWNLIVHDQAPVFLEKQRTPDFHYHSSVTFFYDTFYSRLFDIHPMCKQLFKNGMRSQGTFLVKMISLALSELNDPVKFDATLKKLTRIHYQRGVKAAEYGIVGEVLFYVLHHVLGPTMYTRETHVAWVKIYNRMIQTIIPVAVALELNTGPSEVHLEREYEDCMFPHLQRPMRPSSQDFGSASDEPLHSEKILQQTASSLHLAYARSSDDGTPQTSYRCTWSTSVDG